uniref:COP9 signalosome complex subunit 3 N-terminal helical repeats domain-containing protein n=1 Tax=Anas zonorhyncha TaxID=75864 RepID=A0A8B9ZVN7_9AVES
MQREVPALQCQEPETLLSPQEKLTVWQMTQLCELINKSGELLAKNLSHLDTVLGALDVQEHSLGVLAVLFVKFSMPSIPDFETLFSQVQLFISTCNGEHIRYATDTCKLKSF